MNAWGPSVSRHRRPSPIMHTPKFPGSPRLSGLRKQGRGRGGSMLTGEKRDRGGEEDAKKREGGGWKTKWSPLSSCCTNQASSFPYCPSLRCYLPQPNKEEGLKKGPCGAEKRPFKERSLVGEKGEESRLNWETFLCSFWGSSHPWGNTKIRMGEGTN